MPSSFQFGVTPKNKYLGNLKSTVSTAQGQGYTGSSPVTTNTLGKSFFVGASPATGATPAVPTPSPAKQQFVSNLTASNNVPAPQQQAPTTSQNPTVSAPPTGTANGYVAPPDPNDRYRSALDTYMASLAPSSAETEANKYLNELVLGNKRQMLDIQNRPGQTTSFVGAEQERAGQNNALNIEAASNAVNAFTANRNATTEAQKARLDFEKSMIPKQEAFTLGAGDIRYDSQGNKIAEGGVKPPSLPASAQEYEYAKSQGYKGSYDQYQTDDANRKRSVVNINAAGLTPQLTSTALKLSDDYEQRSKDYYTVRDSYNRIHSAAQNPSAAGDMALLFSYMKILDPNSVVRETEYATAQNAGSIPERTRAAYNAAVNGKKLSDAQRSDFVDRASKIFDTAKVQQDSISKEFTQRADQYGVPSSLVVRDTVATGAPTGSVKSTGTASNPLGI